MTDPTTSPTAADPVRAFLDDIHFATIATIDPDGDPAPGRHLVHARRRRDRLNSAVGRRWPANLLRDPRDLDRRRPTATTAIAGSG